MSDHYGKHFVAIIGGSVAGSEAAALLSEHDHRAVVFDQKNLPYGKIEDGLPSWHVGLRDKEEDAIDGRLNHPNIRFVPGFRLGTDGRLDELINEWGFSAVIIAIGAWHDRKIEIDGIEKFYNKGIVRQNDLVYWFNHKHEPNYNGPVYEIKNNTAIVGGGLASLDMAKITMIELVKAGLKSRKGVDVDLFTIEKKGPAQVLEDNNTSLAELGIEPCTLFYRRDAEDMPLYPRKKETPEGIEQARKVSKKLLENYVEKYLFRFEPRSVPKSIIQENGQFVGMQFQRLDIRDGKLVEIEGDVFDFKTELLISSIGSLPKETPSLPIAGNYLKTEGDLGCRVKGYDNVFAVGNVVTGRGNILESRKHGREITDLIIGEHLAKDVDPMRDKYEDLFRRIQGDVDEKIDSIRESLAKAKPPTKEQVDFILSKTEELQRRAGYDGNYPKWVATNKPVRLEDLT